MVVNQVKKSKKGSGFDAEKGEYVNMIEKGIIDPTKVVRSGLQNAASVAMVIITTEALVTDIPEKKEGRGVLRPLPARAAAPLVCFAPPPPGVGGGRGGGGGAPPPPPPPPPPHLL